MSIAAEHELVYTRAGQPVPVPDGVDPENWAAFVAQVVIVDGGCHLWLGRLDGDTGYGEHRYKLASGNLRVTGAHRYSYAAFNPLPENAHVLHACDERLCAPVTAEAARRHLDAGDAVANALEREGRGRGGRRRFGVRRLGADTRSRTEVSEAMQAAVLTALDLGVPTSGLLAVVEDVYRAGDPMRDQGVLFPVPSRRLRLVR